MKYRYEIKQSNNPSLSSADTFKTAVKAVAVAKKDFAQFRPGVTSAHLSILDDDGNLVLGYELTGAGWVKRQTATEAWSKFRQATK